MKLYTTILLTLIMIGLGLAYKVFSEDEKLDETVFLSTTASIRNLQTLDKNLLVLLQQSRFNPQFDSNSLTETNYELSEEFDNLRYDALFEEIEASEGLSAAIANFEEKFFMREESLEEYISSNTLISQSLDTISLSLETLSMLETPLNDSVARQLIAQSSSAIYQTALGLNKEAPIRNNILDQLNQIQTASTDIDQDLIENYRKAAIEFWNSNEASQTSFNILTTLDTGPLLDDIENEYTNYHNQGIENAAQLRNALIIYGIALLCALLFFGFLIRKNFLSLEQKVADRTQEIEAAYKELQESQEQLIQSEKMASLGEMVAGVAHEINTPLGYVTSNIDTIKLNLSDLNEVVSELEKIYLEALQKPQNKKEISSKLLTTLKTHQKIKSLEIVNESEQLLEDGAYGLSEISKLVMSLKDFARLDRQATEQIDIHDCIENSLTIASNAIKEHNIVIDKQLNDELPKITCMPSKLNQLFLNIINNACQAMNENGGSLLITSEEINNHIVINFKDQGIGMDEQTISKIFDPFFTTKEIGKGTGLGLSIAYKIAKEHGGHIDVKSQLNQGSEMTVHLPISNELIQKAA